MGNNTMALINVRLIDARFTDTPLVENPWRLKVDELAIEGGTLYSLVGDNMVGKSTLLRVLANDVSADFSSDSAIVLDGELIESPGKASRQRAGRRGWMIQLLSHDDSMFPELSIWENVRLARPCWTRLSRQAAFEKLEKYLKRRELFGKVVSPQALVGHLSSGGKSLVRLARATAWGSKVMLVDEVTSHLDKNNSEVFLESLISFVKSGGAAVLVSHRINDHEVARALSERTRTRYERLTIVLEDNVSRVGRM